MLANRFIRCAAALLLAAFGMAAQAQDYPSRPIKLVVTFGPGSGPDTLARELAPRMAELLGQNVVVENKPGGAGNVAALSVLGEKRDGYTLLMGTDSLYSLNPYLFPKAGFDAFSDFTIVAPLAEAALFLVANTSLQVNTVAELVALVRGQPGKLNYSAPSGTPHHLAGERFTAAANLDWVRVSYRDTQQAVTDLLAGAVPVAFSTWPSVQPHVASGKLKALAVTTSNRLDTLPNVPTLAETLPGFQEAGWFAIVVGTGTPQPVIQKLGDAIAKARESKELKGRLEQQGMRLLAQDARSFEGRARDEAARRSALIRARGIKVE